MVYSSTKILLCVLGFSIGVFLWLRFRANSRKRSQDRSKLNPQQRRILHQAHELIGQKNYVVAANLLLSIGQHREAISVLEKNGHINEACQVLLRMNLPHRAGAIYERHQQWGAAADCYERAQKYADVARCASEGSDWARAAKFYEMIKDIKAASGCYIKANNTRYAALLLARNAMDDDSAKTYQRVFAHNLNEQTLPFDGEELAYIERYITIGLLPAEVMRQVALNHRVYDMIIGKLRAGREEEASAIYLSCREDIGPQLIGTPTLTNDESKRLARMFIYAANFTYAGMLFERFGEFEEAGECFRRAEDYQRATYCFERAQNPHKAAEMRQFFAMNSSTALNQVPRLNTPPVFSLTPEESRLEAAAVDNGGTFAEENTIQLDVEKTSPTNPVAIAISLGEPVPEPDEAILRFHQSDFLTELDYHQRQAIGAIGAQRNFKKGEVVLEVDEEPLGIYFVLSGTVGCYKVLHQDLVRIDTLQPSKTFGEFWLLSDLPTRVRFIADTDCELFIVERQAFNTLLDQNGIIARKLYKRFTARLLERLLNPQDNSTVKAAS